jgi:hypothetical protein
MALTDENGGGIPATMLVGPTGVGGGYPVYQGGNGGGFGGGFGNDGWWVILLFLLLIGNNGWGNNGVGNCGNGGGLYPWMNQSNQINDGFRDQMLNTTVNGIQQGVNNLSTQLCNCCGDVQMALANGFAGVEQGANARQIANMQTAFAAQTAQAQGFNNVQAQLAQCCCDNRLATAQTQALVQSENCADRYEAAKNTQGIISAITAGIQSIKDDLCQDRLDAERRENANLRSELMYARGQASQVEQTAQILANNNAQTALFQQGLNSEVDALYSRLSNCPVPSVPVFGNQRIFTCQGNNNPCGCGCGSNNF